MTTHLRRSVFARACLLAVLALVGSTGCRLLEGSLPQPLEAPLLPGQTGGVFTTGHPTLASAVRTFFGVRSEPEQPFEFPHVIHVGRDIGCTEYCHETVLEGPVAGLPSVRTCLSCHRTIATNRPRIRQITNMAASGRDFAWKRVFDYPAEAHVRFNHAPHVVLAEIECATCHGGIARQRLAQRNVEMTMGFCVNCHNERQASVDCLTCHF